MEKPLCGVIEVILCYPVAPSQQYYHKAVDLKVWWNEEPPRYKIEQQVPHFADQNTKAQRV